jgi:hypothetical protein
MNLFKSLDVLAQPTEDGQLAAAEFAKQMLHMPGVVYSSPPFPADTYQMAKTDDDFHCEISPQILAKQRSS